LARQRREPVAEIPIAGGKLTRDCSKNPDEAVWVYNGTAYDPCSPDPHNANRKVWERLVDDFNREGIAKMPNMLKEFVDRGRFE
jgi:hypothetical protein